MRIVCIADAFITTEMMEKGVRPYLQQGDTMETFSTQPAHILLTQRHLGEHCQNCKRKAYCGDRIERKKCG
ncbi:MAG: hypothetical protein IJW88_08275 [Alistipes sp.]|nr:hypothetical protein [Alistipes sp.]